MTSRQTVPDRGSMTAEDTKAERPPLPRVLKAAAAIIAPGTALTALLYYFGWLHTYWFCYYFGVNSTILGFTFEDYLLRNVDGLFVPLTVVAGIGLVALWGHRMLGPYLAKALRVRRPVVIGALAAGFVLSAMGMLNVFGVFALGLAVAPLSLAAGVLLLMVGIRVHRIGEPEPPEWSTLAEWAGVFAIVSICAFWAAGDYAGSVGVGRARQTQAELHSSPAVVLYSAKSLGLSGPGVEETTCTDPDAAYRHRYDGLKLVLQSGNQYFLLPADWSREDGAAIILPRGDTIRLEFTPASAARSDAPCAD